MRDAAAAAVCAMATAPLRSVLIASEQGTAGAADAKAESKDGNKGDSKDGAKSEGDKLEGVRCEFTARQAEVDFIFQQAAILDCLSQAQVPTAYCHRDSLADTHPNRTAEAPSAPGMTGPN